MFDPETGAFAANMAMRKLAESGQVGYTETKVIFPTTELELMEANGIYDQVILTPISLTAGRSYKVNWNGDEYNCVASRLKVDGEVVIAIGNLGIAGWQDTGETFLVLYGEMTDLGDMGIEVITTDSTATLSISTETVRPIDPKYLPGPPHFDLREMGLPAVPLDGTEVEVECDTTELRNAMLAGAVALTAGAAINGEYQIAVSAFVHSARLEEADEIQATSLVLGYGTVYAIFFTIRTAHVRAVAIPLTTP